MAPETPSERPSRPGPRDALTRLEESLRKIAGVHNVRVLGEDEPVEIHVLASSDRPAKQLARDVQSLALAGFGLTIDHRIVSIVQIEGQPANHVELEPKKGPEGGRAVIEYIVQMTQVGEARIDVGLRWPDGKVTGGASPAGPTREAQARASVTATLQALKPALEERSAKLEFDALLIQKVGSNESAVVGATFEQGSTTIPLTGSAIIRDGVANASARAVLDAVNRKLR